MSDHISPALGLATLRSKGATETGGLPDAEKYIVRLTDRGTIDSSLLDFIKYNIMTRVVRLVSPNGSIFSLKVDNDGRIYVENTGSVTADTDVTECDTITARELITEIRTLREALVGLQNASRDLIDDSDSSDSTL